MTIPSTIEHFSLKPESERYPIPRKLPRGNYEWNHFDARFFSIEQDVYTEESFVQGEDVDILLFMNDFPIVCDIDSFYSSFDTPALWNFKDFKELGFYSAGITIGNQLITADAIMVDLYEQVTGVTITNLVDVQGYLIYGEVLDRGIQTTPTPETPNLWALVKGDSGVVHGIPHFVSDHIANPRTVVPTIMHEPDYTAAMHDAGFVDVATVRYVFVGIYQHGTR